MCLSICLVLLLSVATIESIDPIAPKDQQLYSTGPLTDSMLLATTDAPVAGNLVSSAPFFEEHVLRTIAEKTRSVVISAECASDLNATYWAIRERQPWAIASEYGFFILFFLNICSAIWERQHWTMASMQNFLIFVCGFAFSFCDSTRPSQIYWIGGSPKDSRDIF